MAYWRLYYHFVWSTQDRIPYITPEIEPVLYRLLYQEANDMHCPFFYVGGISDHVHVLTAVRPSVSPADFMKQLKGTSSRIISLEFNCEFEWQKGYGVFSVDRTNIDSVKAYVLNQKRRHANNNTVARLEESHDWNLGPDEIPIGDTNIQIE